MIGSNFSWVMIGYCPPAVLLFVNKLKMEVTSSWSVDNNVEIEDIIQESTKFPTGDFVDLLDEEKCISLSRPATEDEDCFIRLVSKPGQTLWQIQQGLKSKNKKLVLGIMLLSEARVVEVCTGSHDEYCKTVHGTLMRDFEDSQIYKCEVQFDNPKDKVMLKLKATFHGNSLWVFGFHVTTAVEPAIQTGSRFSSDHLTTVLKDKDVQMSKQAIKFRQMLVNFNSVNETSNPFIENSAMALMSMMLGPMMSASRSSLSSADVDSTQEIKSKKRNISISSDHGHIVQTQDTSKENIIKGCELKSSQDLCANGSYLATNIEGEIQNGLRNGMKNIVMCSEDRKENKIVLSQGNVENVDKSKDAAVHRDNLVEKLHALLNDGNSIVLDQQKLNPLMDIVLKAGTSTSKAVVESAKGYFTKSTGMTDQTASNSLQAAQAVVDSAKKLHISSRDQYLAKLSSGDCLNSSAIPRTKEALGSEETEEMKALSNEVHQAVTARGNPSEYSEALVNCIENLIDKKFATMEERLMQRVEEKLLEKAKEDTVKLDRIEGLLVKLCEKL